jgi:spore coat protein U-like protein
MLRWVPTLLALVLAALAVLGGSADVSAQKQMRCSITNAVGPSFGGYDTLSTAPLDTAGFVSFRCEGVQPGAMLVLELSRGRGHSFLPRHMARRGKPLEYNLYLDAARTVVWGDGSRGTSRYQARPIEGRTESVPIYARIPPRQTVVPGSYSDHVTLTVQY